MLAHYVAGWSVADNNTMILNGLTQFSTFRWLVLEAGLLSDAEGGEDQAQDVVGSGLAGKRVERPERAIKVEKNHFVGNAGGVGFDCVAERGERGDDCLLLTEIG